MGVPLSQARFELMGFYYTPAMGIFYSTWISSWNDAFFFEMLTCSLGCPDRFSALKHLLHLAGLYFPYDWLQTILVKERCREAIYRQPESFRLKVPKTEHDSWYPVGPVGWIPAFQCTCNQCEVGHHHGTFFRVTFRKRTFTLAGSKIPSFCAKHVWAANIFLVELYVLFLKNLRASDGPCF